MFKRLPSLSITLAALGFGLVLAYGINILERFGIVNSEEFGWKVINRMGWWWWSIPIAASCIGLFYMMKLDRPRTRLGWLSRVGAMTGFVLYLGSWANTALGPVSAILIAVSFVAVIKQQASACQAAREQRPDYSEQRWLVRFFSSLTTEADEKVRG